MCVSKEGYEERKKALIRLQTNIQINNMQEKEIEIISFESQIYKWIYLEFLPMNFKMHTK